MQALFVYDAVALWVVGVFVCLVTDDGLAGFAQLPLRLHLPPFQPLVFPGSESSVCPANKSMTPFRDSQVGLCHPAVCLCFRRKFNIIVLRPASCTAH